MIRKEDITATKKDEVEVYNCFGPGDIILARVVSQLEFFGSKTCFLVLKLIF